ncbi:MAG: pyrroline-5-carboxylate reductase [Spirochaetales bacterium]|nr:pyrroline-5-carboxylate reductase [Spirochaetales bacterium]
MKTIGIIGFGNMGSAVAAGLKKQGLDVRIGVREVMEDKARLAKEEYGLEIFKSNRDLLDFADVSILAIKPQELDGLFKEIKGQAADKKIISIAAGRKIEYFQKGLNTPFVTRFMPNIAAIEGKALVGIAYGDKVDEGFKAECRQIAGAIGTPCEIKESLMSAVTGLSGSGIAFVFSFIHALALGGVQCGINYDKAVEIAVATVEGAAALVKSGKKNPIELLSRVISPAGTTIEGIGCLEEAGFTHSVMKAVQKASEKAAKLEG